MLGYSCPADQWTGFTKVEFIFVSDWWVLVHLLVRSFVFSSFKSARVRFVPFRSCVTSLNRNEKQSLNNWSFLCFLRISDFQWWRKVSIVCWLGLNIDLTVTSSVAWEEGGIYELHVVGYVYHGLLVCSANFTYIYAKSLSALYSLCLLYTQIQHIE